ncbi:MAG: hypothetical protein BGO68_02790 [Candidatus Amoebophilus sp. 36-38]|nr:MAG: hypothetical protein BGO68_02790 [Candidatus Amoebophilus sp. 36-38]
MKKVLKVIYKSLVTLFFVLLCFLLATGVYIYNYQEQIIARAFQAATSQLSYSIQAKNIQLSLFRDFPRLSLLLQDVVIQDSQQNSKNILVANKVDCVFNIHDLLQGQYILHELCVEQGTLSLEAQQKQKQVLHKTVAEREQADFKPSHLVLPVNLKKVVLNQVKCVYATSLPDQRYVVYAQQLQVACNLNIKDLSMHVVGNVVIQQIKYKNIMYESDVPTSINARVQYDIAKQLYRLQHGRIREDESNIRFQGVWSNQVAEPFIDLQISTDRLAIPHILRWLPISYRQRTTDYQVQGNLICQIHLIKQPKKDVSITTDFKIDKISLLPTGLKQPFQLEHLMGKLYIPNLTTLDLANLQIDEYRARWGDSHFTGHMKLTDLKKLWLQNHTNVVIDLPSLAPASHPSINNGLQGQLVGYVDLEGSLYDLLYAADKRSLPSLKGQLDSRGIQVVYNQNLLQLQDASSLLVENDVLHFKELAGQIEGKPFVLTGKLTNWLKFLLKKEDNLYVDAKLYAEYIELSKLFVSDDPDTTSAKYLAILPYLAGELVCDVGEIVYKRFRGDKLRGKLRIDEQQLVADSVELGFAGGKSWLTGTIDTKSDRIQIHTHASLQNVQLPTLFYTFENFHQDFLENKHLDGRIWSEIDLTMQADKNFYIDRESVLANISIQLDKGILQNFEPLQRLTPYVSEKELKYLHFSSLKNNIHVKNKTIYIPPMEVHTSVTSIQLSGTHTFDGDIQYNLIVPLQHATSKEIRRQLPEINEEALAGLNLYLKLEGNIHHYNLSYDNALFKANLKESLKKQRNILGEILQGKGLPKRTKELSKEEYFDFE